MAEIATLARPYARAAFESALDDGDDGLDRWSGMLALLGAAAADDTLAAELASPSRTPEAKATLLVELGGDRLSERARNLLGVLADNDRLELLGEIATQFEALKDAHQRTLEVEVVSARDLSKEDLSKLGSRLTKRFDKEITLTSRVDPALLGGALIRAGDLVIDGSVRGRLDKLAERLRAR